MRYEIRPVYTTCGQKAFQLRKRRFVFWWKSVEIDQSIERLKSIAKHMRTQKELA